MRLNPPGPGSRRKIANLRSSLGQIALIASAAIPPKKGQYIMVKRSNPAAEPMEEYEILVKGILSDQWTDWFDGMDLRTDGEGNTILTGRVVDQAALYGLLDKCRDLGLTLLSFTRLNR
jgi:hypothetical protein